MKKAAAIGNVIFIYLAALLPLLLFANGKNAFITGIWEHFFSNNVFIPLFLLLIFGVVMYIINIVLFLEVRRKRFTALELARTGMIVKLIQIPAYLFIFVMGLLCMVMIFTMGITFIFVLLDLFSTGMTGVYASAVFYQLRKERFIPVKTQICGVLASFVFCADVIAAIAGYRICVRGGKMCDGSSEKL
ncbi:MAG: hypothetical protein HFI69_07200 [Lachnospiraceae bacterium]|nr:hypothetical protein [Lachnospiraceae bacterium]